MILDINKDKKYHLRLCEFCDLKVLVDEFDFVFYCPLHYDLRNSLFELIQLKKS